MNQSQGIIRASEEGRSFQNSAKGCEGIYLPCLQQQAGRALAIIY